MVEVIVSGRKGLQRLSLLSEFLLKISASRASEDLKVPPANNLKRQINSEKIKGIA